VKDETHPLIRYEREVLTNLENSKITKINFLRNTNGHTITHAHAHSLRVITLQKWKRTLGESTLAINYSWKEIMNDIVHIAVTGTCDNLQCKVARPNWGLQDALFIGSTDSRWGKAVPLL
jgi:hypothetical protein